MDELKTLNEIAAHVALGRNITCQVVYSSRSVLKRFNVELGGEVVNRDLTFPGAVRALANHLRVSANMLETGV